MPLHCYLSETNPNDSTGGGGSLAGPMKDADAHGPWIIWPNQEFESGASPHCVVAASEVAEMVRLLKAERPLGAGEKCDGPPILTFDSIIAERGIESPEFDLSDPEDVARAAEYAAPRE